MNGYNCKTWPLETDDDLLLLVVVVGRHYVGRCRGFTGGRGGAILVNINCFIICKKKCT